MTLGWYHYHTNKSDYWARTAFACAGCGTTHYIEHAADAEKKDRYLYHDQRSKLLEELQASMPPGEPLQSCDLFTGFEGFVCPVCHSRGQVLTEQAAKEKSAACPICGGPTDELGFWMT
jgi:rubrerythrin